MFFPYEYDRCVTGPLRLLGVRADRDGVRVDDDRLVATFGFLNLTVPLTNIEGAQVTGPYRWYRALGPRLSYADHGVTFGTTTRGGACLRFIEPIPPVFGPWRHPGLTVTVDQPQALVDHLTDRLGGLE